MLEYFKQARRWSLLHAFSAVCVLVIAGTVLSGGLGWVADWFSWAVIAATALYFFAVQRGAVFAAGARWLTFGNKWVRIYELAEVRVKARGPNWWRIVLVDRNGRRVNAPLNQLVQNRELWDLVYNGILRSVHTGKVRTNRTARRLLRLPNPPADDG